MFEITRRIQRHRLQTEFFKTFSSLPPNPGLAEKYEPLLRFDESLFRPGAELVLESIDNIEIVWMLLDGYLNLQIGNQELKELRKNQLCRAVIGSPAPIYYRNPSEKVTARFLEIWFLPEETAVSGVSIGSCQFQSGPDRFLTVASGQEHPDSIPLSQDSAIHYFQLRPNESFIFETLFYRNSYIWIVTGALRIGENRILNQDGILIGGENTLTLNALQQTTALLIDLPGEPPAQDIEEGPA